MKKLSKLKLAKSDENFGFITLEVLVSILIASAFLAVAMQSLVYAMAIKVQAQEKQRANQLISDDLETANELANRSSFNVPVNCNPANFNGGYANGLWETLKDIDNDGTDDPPPSKSLLSDGGGRRLALERILVGGSDAPHRTLKIRYQIWNWNGTNFLDKAGNIKDAADEPISETYVEIIPDVALACP